MDWPALRSSAWRLATAWVVLTLVVTAVGSRLVVSVGPVIELAVEQLMPGFVTSISRVSRDEGAGDVAMQLQAMRPLRIADDYWVTPWVKVEERINAGHDLVPAIILFAVLLAWPYRRIGDAARALCLGLLVAVGLITWMTSVHFAGLFEISLQRVAAQYRQARPQPLFLAQMIFFESGGQWLLALLGATAIGAFTTRHTGRLRRQPAPPSGEIPAR